MGCEQITHLIWWHERSQSIEGEALGCLQQLACAVAGVQQRVEDECDELLRQGARRPRGLQWERLQHSQQP